MPEDTLVMTGVDLLGGYIAVKKAWCEGCMFIHDNVDPKHRDPQNQEPVLFVRLTADRWITLCPQCIADAFESGGFKDLFKVKEEGEDEIPHELIQAVRNVNVEPINAGLREGTLSGLLNGLKHAKVILDTLLSLARR